MIILTTTPMPVWNILKLILIDRDLKPVSVQEATKSSHPLPLFVVFLCVTITPSNLHPQSFPLWENPNLLLQHLFCSHRSSPNHITSLMITQHHYLKPCHRVVSHKVDTNEFQCVYGHYVDTWCQTFLVVN